MRPGCGWGTRGERLIGKAPLGHRRTLTFLAAPRCDIITEGAAFIDRSEVPLGSHVFILVDTHDVRRGLVWHIIGRHPNQTSGLPEPEEAIIRRLRADSPVLKPMKARMHLGMVLLMTDLPACADTRTGTDLVIMTPDAWIAGAASIMIRCPLMLLAGTYTLVGIGALIIGFVIPDDPACTGVRHPAISCLVPTHRPSRSDRVHAGQDLCRPVLVGSMAPNAGCLWWRALTRRRSSSERSTKKPYQRRELERRIVVDIRNIIAVVGLASTVGLITACAGSAPTGGSDLNKPGSWAYEGCKQAVLERVKRDHPQVQAIQLDGHVNEIKETDSRSALTGQGKFPKNGDNFHFSFRCEVNRDLKTVGNAKYDKI